MHTDCTAVYIHHVVNMLEAMYSTLICQFVSQQPNLAKQGSACVTTVLFLQIHGENGDAIAMAQKTTFEAGITGPEGHVISRPAYLEVSPFQLSYDQALN